jgi:hypothetical protein
LKVFLKTVATAAEEAIMLLGIAINETNNHYFELGDYSTISRFADREKLEFVFHILAFSIAIFFITLSIAPVL